MSQPPPPQNPATPPSGFQPDGGLGGYPGQGHPSQQRQQPQLQAQAPKRGNVWKWVLGTLILLTAVAVTAVVTMSLVKGNGTATPRGDAASSGDGNTSPEIGSTTAASPVTVIVDDPSCAPAGPILETRAQSQRNGWDKRDASIAAADWSPDVRSQYEAVAQSMRQSADQLVSVVKLTPHRAMRQLYEQIIAYSREYADRIPTYTPVDDNAALVSTNAATAVSLICAAIQNGSAAARGPLVEADAPARSLVALAGDPANPKPFLSAPNSQCADWVEALTTFDNDTVDWRAIPAEVPFSQWTPEQKDLNKAVIPVMRRLASQQQLSGERSGNVIWRDFADLSAQYRLSYAEALATYLPADDVLSAVSLRLGSTVSAACRLAG